MQQPILETIRAILQSEMPKNSVGTTVILDRPITGWYIGDRTLLAAPQSIVFEAGSSAPKDVAFGTIEITHRSIISAWSRNDDPETATRVELEMARLIYYVMLRHRQIWVMEPCPFCLKTMLSPQHFTIDDAQGGHSSLLAPFVALAAANYASRWSLVHPTSAQQPQESASALAADGFLLLYEAVRTFDPGNPNPNLSGVSSAAMAVIQQYQKDLVIPIRLLYNAVFTDPKLAEETKEQQLLRGAEFTFEAKETLIIPDFGPDNVTTAAWSAATGSHY